MFLLISFEKITIKLFLYIKSQWKKKSALGLQRGSKNHQEDTAPLWIVITNYQNYKNIRNLWTIQNFEKIEKGLKSYTIKRNSRNVKTISKLLGKLKQMIWKIKVFHEYFSKTLWINKTSTIDKIVIVDKFDEFFII